MGHPAFALPNYLGAGSAQRAYAAPTYAPVNGAPYHPTALKSEGFRAGEIIGWRAWKIMGTDLYSLVANEKLWSPADPMQGNPAAGYGVHAYKGPHGPLLDSYVNKHSQELWVIGEVALWGDVIEHEEGYRAEFGRVKSLITWHERISASERKVICEKYLIDLPAQKLDDAA